jgi:hypothetical protein
MRHLINRDEYIKEYLRIVNQELITNNSNQVESENELYEGLLGTLFGGLKMLLKKDWANIKCKNPSVLKYLQEIDKSLGGYTMMKMQFSGECTTIRQNLADYFNDILDYKLAQIEKEEDPNKFLKKEKKEKEENKEAKGVAKNLNLKDKTLLDSLDKYKSNINTACKPSPKLREYADMMLNSIEIFVNGVILAELEKKGVDKKKLEEKNKENEENKRKMEEENNKKNEESRKAEEEAMKKLNDERDRLIKSIGGTLIGSMSGDKAVTTIASAFDDIVSKINSEEVNESKVPIDIGAWIENDTYIGIKNIFECFDWSSSKIDKLNARIILNKINDEFKEIDGNKSIYTDVPSTSIQAMMIAISFLVVYGIKGAKYISGKGDDILSLISKCAIDSDATIGFSLPLIDIKKTEQGNVFVSILYKLRDTKIDVKYLEEITKSMSEKEKKSLAKNHDGDFSAFLKSKSGKLTTLINQHISKLSQSALELAKKIKEDAKKKREADAAKAQQESDANEKK